MALTTNANLNTISNTTIASGLAELAIAWAGATIESYIGQSVLSGSYEEMFDVNSNVIVLGAIPVISVAVTRYGYDIIEEGIEYEIDEDKGLLTSDYGNWPSHTVVTYTAGLSAVPKDIEMVATMLALDFLSGKAPGLKSESIPDAYSYTKFEDIDPIAPYKAILNKYKRW